MVSTLIKIRGAEFPEPVEFSVEYEPIGSFERNANGGMVGDLVATKCKLSCGWGMISDEFFRYLLEAVSPFFVEVEFFDPSKNENTVMEMYAVMKSGRLAFKKDSGAFWGNVSCIFTER